MANFSIPGDIKNNSLPFKGNDNLVFSFKPSRIATFGNNSNVGLLNFCPISVKRGFDEDTANKVLYSVDDKLEKQKQSITYNQVLEHIPSVVIREYLPDSKLDLVLNLFGDLMAELKNGFSDPNSSVKPTQSNNDSSTADKPNELSLDDKSSFMKKIINTAWYIFQWLTDTADDSSKGFITSFTKNFKDSVAFGLPLAKYKINAEGAKNLEKKILDFPFALYYGLLSGTNLNVYEIPGMSEGNLLYTGNGAVGWPDGDGKQLGAKGDGLLSSVVNNIFGNIGISWTPWWDPSKGVGTKDDDINVKFDLYNDTVESAISNFIFITTLVGNARWIQYGLFLHSPSLYDIKLEGYNRLFACTGSFQVVGLGIFRNPSKKFFDELIKLKCGYTDSVTQLIKSKSIRIPDVYTVTMTFKSLVPQNLNTFLYNYSHNYDQFSTPVGHYPSGIIKAITGTVKDGINDIKSFWNDKADSTDLTPSQDN